MSHFVKARLYISFTESWRIWAPPFPFLFLLVELVFTFLFRRRIRNSSNFPKPIETRYAGSRLVSLINFGPLNEFSKRYMRMWMLTFKIFAFVLF